MFTSKGNQCRCTPTLGSVSVLIIDLDQPCSFSLEQTNISDDLRVYAACSSPGNPEVRVSAFLVCEKFQLTLLQGG